MRRETQKPNIFFALKTHKIGLKTLQWNAAFCGQRLLFVAVQMKELWSRMKTSDQKKVSGKSHICDDRRRVCLKENLFIWKKEKKVHDFEVLC